MKFEFKSRIWMTAALLLPCPVLKAQEARWDRAITLRAGSALGQVEDHLARRILGFGLGVGYTFGWGRLGLDAGFLYKAGDQYYWDLSRMPSVPGANIPPIGIPFSVDSRKSDLQGLTSRISYEKSMGSFGLQLGVQLAGLTFRQEYVGNIRDKQPIGNVKLTYHDGYYGSSRVHAMTLSPFVGVNYRISNFSMFELTLIQLKYKSVDYIHVWGQNKVTDSVFIGGITTLDHTVEANRSKLHLEFGYTFRF